MIHPSLILKVNLDEREATKAVIEELKRSYAYVGPISVGKHEAGDPACNVMRMMVRMSKPYWKSEVENADAMWDAVNEWLVNKLYKVGSTVVNYNKSHEGTDRAMVEYGRLELDMKPYVLGFALPTVDEFPAVNEQVARFRELLNDGTIADDVAQVNIPSTRSAAEQYAAAKAAAEEAARKAAEEAAAKAAEEAAKAAEEAAAQEAAQAEGKQGAEVATAEVAAEPVAAEEAPAAGEAVDEQGDEGEQAEAAAEPAQPAEPVVSMPVVDYAVWGVVLADGTERELDATTGAWL